VSRIGRQPVPVPKGVQVTVAGQVVTVKGPKGTLNHTLPAEVKARVEGSVVQCDGSVDSKRSKSVWGLSRVLLHNMMIGVTDGYQKNLEVVGVGYRAEMKGKDLVLAVGLSHPVRVRALDGITFSTEGPKIAVKGADKEMVGRVAATLRSLRPPEPYKGKGIKYTDERIVRKAGKTAGK